MTNHELLYQKFLKKMKGLYWPTIENVCSIVALNMVLICSVYNSSRKLFGKDSTKMNFS